LFPLFATGVNDTGGKLPPVSTTQAELVAKFSAGVVETGGNLPPVSLIPTAICHRYDTDSNLSPVSLTPVANFPPPV
jgi:hypothetical protein